MSKYTTEVRFICESAANLTESEGFNSIDTILSVAAPKIFNFDFPLFDENYRTPLEKKILRHFYTREISEETVGLWKLRLQDRLCMIMPYYNQLYSSELIKFNPLYDVDLTRDHVRENDSEENTINTGSMSGTTQDSIQKQVARDLNDAGTENTVIDRDTSDALTSETNTDTTNTGKTTNADGIHTHEDQHYIDARGITTNKSGSDTNHTDERQDITDYGNSEFHKLNYDLYSDTPQGDISGFDPVAAYLTNGRKIMDDENTSSNNHKIGSTVTDNTSNSTGLEQTTDQDESSKVTETEVVTAKEENRTDSGNEKTDVNSTRNVAEDTTEDKEHYRLETENTNENATNTGEETRETSHTGKTTIDSTENYIEHVVGKNGGVSYSKMLIEFRETFLNIDRMIIRDLEPLFFGLWE